MTAETKAVKRWSSHGMSRTPTYKSWREMMTRTLNPKSPDYAKYGASGIGVCDRWKDFREFFRDMGVRPFGTSLDRIDNQRGYEPENCRWATRVQQNRNMTTNKITDDDATEIRRLVASGERSAVVAERFGIVPDHVRQIVRGTRRA